MLKKILILFTICLTLTKSYTPTFSTDQRYEDRRMTKMQAINKVNADFANQQFSYQNRSLKRGLWRCLRRCRRRFKKCLKNKPPWICWWRYKKCVWRCFW